MLRPSKGGRARHRKRPLMKHETMESLRACEDCRTLFMPSRKDQRYCSDRCRKNKSQKARRKEFPVNSTSSPSKRQDNRRLFDSAARHAEILYTLPPGRRLGFMKELIDAAREGDSHLRQMLTNKYILKAGREHRWLFYPRPQGYYTISQAADRYCRMYWNASVADVVYGCVPEPLTGEVIKRRHHNNIGIALMKAQLGNASVALRRLAFGAKLSPRSEAAAA